VLRFTMELYTPVALDGVFPWFTTPRNGPHGPTHHTTVVVPHLFFALDHTPFRCRDRYDTFIWFIYITFHLLIILDLHHWCSFYSLFGCSGSFIATDGLLITTFHAPYRYFTHDFTFITVTTHPPPPHTTHHPRFTLRGGSSWFYTQLHCCVDGLPRGSHHAFLPAHTFLHYLYTVHHYRLLLRLCTFTTTTLHRTTGIFHTLVAHVHWFTPDIVMILDHWFTTVLHFSHTAWLVHRTILGSVLQRSTTAPIDHHRTVVRRSPQFFTSIPATRFSSDCPIFLVPTPQFT